MKGLVVKNTGSWYQVKTENGDFYDCKIKGNLRLKGIRSTNPIAVGDYVDFTLSDDNIGSIHAIHDRKNYIIRRSSNLSKHSHILAANLDLVILIATVNYPETSTVLLIVLLLLRKPTVFLLVCSSTKSICTMRKNWNMQKPCKRFTRS